MDNCSQVLTSLTEILKHIQEVQDDVSKLSKDSMLVISKMISASKLEFSAEDLSALQHQDILSQQLSAASDAIIMINQYLEKYVYTINEDSNLMASGFIGLNAKLKQALEKAKDRKDAFSGHAFENKEEEIEFF